MERVVLVPQKAGFSERRGRERAPTIGSFTRVAPLPGYQGRNGTAAGRPARKGHFLFGDIIPMPYAH